MSGMNAMLQLRQALQGLQRNVGTLGEFADEVRRGSSSNTQDQRSALYKFRENEGLDEPAQLVEQGVRSSAIDAVREVADAYLRPANPLKEIGFSNDMLRHRQQNGQTIIDDMSFFDRRIQHARELKRDAMSGLDRARQQSDFGNDKNWVPDLEPLEYKQVLDDASNDLRRMMREKSILSKAGRVIGQGISDISEDKSRAIWWLLNAPQASTAVIADLAVGATNPNLRGRRVIKPDRFLEAERQGLIRRVIGKPSGSPTQRNAQGPMGDEPSLLTIDDFEPAIPGVRKAYDKENSEKVFTQRRASAGKIALFGLGGTALATNAGLGLIGTEDTGIPLIGRREGYAAAAPSEDDARISNSPVEEGLSRYVLSRDGKLLPKREFLMERGDVNPKDFSKYIAYSNDKNTDLNVLDGKFNIGGILKGTTDGIHGPELQFLGQTLSLNEAIVPIAGALAGTAVGGLAPNIRQLRLRKHRTKERLAQLGQLNSYQAPKTVMGKVMANMPDVKSKNYGDQEGDTANPWITQGSVIDNLTKRHEDIYTEINPVTGQRDMNVTANALAMAIGAGSGLGAATLIGLAAEDRRRRANFEGWAPENMDYDTTVNRKKEMLDVIKAKEKALPEQEKKKYKWKSEKSDAMKKEYLSEQLVQQQSIFDSLVLDEKQRRQGQSNLNQQADLLKKLNALYPEQE